MSNDRNSKLILVFFLGLLLFCFPLTGVFQDKSTTSGIPAAYLYFFIAWLIVIGLTFTTLRR